MMKFNKLAIVMGMAVALPVAMQADCGKETCSASAKATAECSAAKCETACCAADTATKKAGLTMDEHKVSGMTSGGCTSKVKDSLTKVKGVNVETVCHESNKAVVAYNLKQVKDKDVVAAIKQAGFKVEAEVIQVSVDGMTCGGCSSKVSQALTKVNGVKEQKVCHVSKKAVVTFDPNKVTNDKIVAAINGTGFKVVE